MQSYIHRVSKISFSEIDERVDSEGKIYFVRNLIITSEDGVVTQTLFADTCKALKFKKEETEQESNVKTQKFLEDYYSGVTTE